MRSVLWFLWGSRTIASSRLHGYLIHRQFASREILSSIVYAPAKHLSSDLPRPGISGFPARLDGTVSIIQKLRGRNTDCLIDWLQANGSKVLYVNCDLEQENRTWLKADRILVPTDRLKGFHLACGARDVRVVKEPYEYAISPGQKSFAPGKRTVAWFGNRLNWSSLQPWKELIEKRFGKHVELVTCSDHRDATFKWSFKRQRQLLSEASFVIIPSGQGEEFVVKSPNRLVQSFAASAPVIAGPLPSYARVLCDAKAMTGRCCGFIAETDDEFCTAVEGMLDSGFRTAAAEACFDYVVARYSLPAVGEDWETNVFDGIESDVLPLQHLLRSAQSKLKIRSGGLCRPFGLGGLAGSVPGLSTGR